MTCLSGSHVAAQVHVGDEQDVALRQVAADLHGVRGGHAHVGPGLRLGGGVDVAHDGQVVAVFGAHAVDVGLADHVRHGAVGCGFGQKHRFVRIEQLRRFAHELDAAQHDGLLRQVDGQFRQGEAVADVVGGCLHLGRHVVVRQDHGVALLFQLRDLLGERWTRPRQTLARLRRFALRCFR